jgi:isoleucyl-tRNA synthetase
MIYRNLVCSIDDKAPISVHMCSFPVCDESRIDPEMEEDMDFVLRAVTLGRAARSASGVKNRQPLSKLFVRTEKTYPQMYTELIADELNVKNVEFTADASGFTTYSLKPQMRTLGPKYGKMLGQIGKYLAECDGNAVMASFADGGTYSFELDGTAIELTRDDVLATEMNKPGFAAESDKELTVVLDTALTDELVEEGTVREVISKVQNMRKKVGLEVTDHIRLSFSADEALMQVIEKYASNIGGASLADAVVFREELAFAEVWDINGEKLTIGMEKA